jgi:NhaP-type Na+/H+ or K+/H+ antiporter
MPGTPQVTLDPDLALALFVAPVLLDAAYDASPRDLRHNLAPVLNLALFTVLLTVCEVLVFASETGHAPQEQADEAALTDDSNSHLPGG